MTRTFLIPKRGGVSVLLAGILGAAIALPGFAQQNPLATAGRATATQADRVVPQDPLGRTSPYETVTRFLTTAERGDFASAAAYLDSKQTDDHRQGLARDLANVLNLGLKIDLGSLSKQPEGNLSDGLPQTLELVGDVRVGDSSLEIFLHRVQQKTSPPIWLFSAETLLNLPDFAEKIAPPWNYRYLPKWLVENSIGGIPLYRWIFTPLFLLLVFATARLATWLLARSSRRFFRRAIQKRVLLAEIDLSRPVLLLISAILISVGSWISTTLMARNVWSRLASILIVIAMTWFILRVIEIASSAFTGHLRRTQAQGRIAAVQLSCKTAEALAVVIALLVVLKLLGIDLTTAIAGLGIGGLALAFAAQKTIENLFGTVMLVTDQPVRVGDFCRVGDTQGTVEDIGLRSTRIRTLNRTVVSVPNGQVASMVVENFALRDKIWFNHTIGLRYETAGDQLRYVLATIRELLYKHPKVESESARIRFIRFGNSSLDIEIFAYVFAHDIATFLEIQEDLLLRIMDIIERSGTSVAIPSRTAYLAKDSGLDLDKGKTVMAQVAQWRDQTVFPFPNHAPEQIAEFKNSIEYPPPGSALREGK